jgi:two-component system chemotaxis response regulator CheB
VVQHIRPGYIGGLADWLQSVLRLNVQVAVPGAPLAPRTVYFAPDHAHLGVANASHVLLSRAPPIQGFQPSATFLFESVAQSFGAATVAVMLTGMGQDGVEGLGSVRHAGGCILAQDEKSCVVFGMPSAAIEAGVVDHTLSIDAMSHRLRQLV